MRCSLLTATALVFASACSSSSSEVEPESNTEFSPPGGTTSPGEGTGAAPTGTTPNASGAGTSSNGGEGTPNVSGLTPDQSGAASGAANGSGDASADASDTGTDTASPDEAGAPGGGPSAGCGLANPPTGAGSLTIRGAQADYVITLPPSYDPNTPAPLVFGFHGRNRTHVEFQTVDAGGIQTELGSRAVMAYLKSQGGPGWNFDAEVPPSVEFFEAMYTQMLDNYCIDTSRVFLTGHSSGAYFSYILACRFGERFRAIGGVAGAQQEFDCSEGRVPAMLIHGTTDTVVSFASGQQARDFYLERNGCDATTAPGTVAPCVAYQGCDPGLPVQWCEHTEPEYFDMGRATNHGWPSFASRAIADFFFAL